MANLELLVSELPKLIQSLKLTIGDSHEIMQQIILINNAQEELRNIQKLITQELKFGNFNNSAIATLPKINTSASLFVSDVGLINTVLAAKFGNWETKFSLIDLDKKIDAWIEWGYFLQALAADILSDVQLVNQFNSDSYHISLPANFQEIAEKLKINLMFNNPKKLEFQLQQLSKYQNELLQLEQKLNYIFNTVKTSHSLLTILLGISAFCGKSGFTLEWLDDDHELIITTDGKIQELTNILNDCDIFQEQTASLIIHSDSLKKQAEQALKKIEQQSTKKIIHNNELEKPIKITTSKILKSAFFIVSTLLLLGFCSRQMPNQNLQLESRNLNPEQRAIANFKSAQKLGLEAASLVQKPPHSLQVWQQAETKWHQAIKLLNSIPPQTSVANQAKNKLTRYQANYAAISKIVLTEKTAINNLKSAQKLAIEATFFVHNSPHSAITRQQAKDKWEQAINLLEAIPENSSVSAQAKETLPIYKTNYAAIRSK